MDTMKWLRQLPDAELLAFWHMVDARIADKIQVVRHTDHADVCFWEYGWGDEEEAKEAVPTWYWFHDYCVRFKDVYGSDEDEADLTRQYLRFMTGRFGKEYLAGYLSYRSGIESSFFIAAMGIQWTDINNKTAAKK